MNYFLQIRIDDEHKKMLVMALAHLAVERPDLKGDLALLAAECGGEDVFSKYKKLKESARLRDDQLNADDLCTIWVALGYAPEKTNEDGTPFDVQRGTLERIRDLIAKEGELGDIKEGLKKLVG